MGKKKAISGTEGIRKQLEQIETLKQSSTASMLELKATVGFLPQVEGMLDLSQVRQGFLDADVDPVEAFCLLEYGANTEAKEALKKLASLCVEGSTVLLVEMWYMLRSGNIDFDNQDTAVEDGMERYAKLSMGVSNGVVLPVFNLKTNVDTLYVCTKGKCRVWGTHPQEYRVAYDNIMVSAITDIPQMRFGDDALQHCHPNTGLQTIHGCSFFVAGDEQIRRWAEHHGRYSAATLQLLEKFN